MWVLTSNTIKFDLRVRIAEIIVINLILIVALNFNEFWMKFHISAFGNSVQWSGLTLYKLIFSVKLGYQHKIFIFFISLGTSGSLFTFGRGLEKTSRIFVWNHLSKICLSVGMYLLLNTKFSTKSDDCFDCCVDVLVQDLNYRSKGNFIDKNEKIDDTI